MSATDNRWNAAWVLPLVFYVVGFAAFPPSERAVATSDEASYLGQARLFSEGRTTQALGDPFDTSPHARWISDYPVGTSLLQAPFVHVGGLIGGRLPSLLCLLAATALTAATLRRRGHDPRFALLVLCYLPALVLGRVGMSDVPSLALASGFFATIEREGARWKGVAGLIAGISLCFRETNVLPMIPFALGVVYRRESGGWALVVGGLTGLALRLVSSAWLFGDAFYTRGAYAFTPNALGTNAGLYALALLVLAPAGLWVVARYSGPRAAETKAAVALTLGFFLIYSYSGTESGVARRLIVGPRYFVTLLPLFALAWGEVAARPGWSERLEVPLRGAVVVACVLAFSVHPVLARWDVDQQRIVEVLFESTRPEEPILTQSSSTSKYLAPVFGPRIVADVEAVPAARVAEICEVHGGATVAYVLRSDSDYHRGRASMLTAYVSELQRVGCSVETVRDEIISEVERVRVVRVSGCRSGV